MADKGVKELVRAVETLHPQRRFVESSEPEHRTGVPLVSRNKNTHTHQQQKQTKISRRKQTQQQQQ